ncbi:MAG: HesA/MoeB/ThiF family protein [Pseudomonadota bacterium]
MSLSPSERERYKRHLYLPEMGGQGQQKLKAARVLILGLGGLGCPIATYLTAAGIGTLGLCDGDRVELSNLQRQPLYTTKDISHPKVEVAAKALQALNPEVNFQPYPTFMTEANAEDLIKDYDLVVEGLDRYAPRYILNQACLKLKKPFLSCAIGKFDGQIALFEPGRAHKPCYRCLVPSAPTDEALCETEGVLGATPGVVGSLAALEAIKWIVKMEGALSGQLLIYDGLRSHLRKLTLPKDPQCPTCAAIT